MSSRQTRFMSCVMNSVGSRDVHAEFHVILLFLFSLVLQVTLIMDKLPSQTQR